MFTRRAPKRLRPLSDRLDDLVHAMIDGMTPADMESELYDFLWEKVSSAPLNKLSDMFLTYSIEEYRED